MSATNVCQASSIRAQYIRHSAIPSSTQMKVELYPVVRYYKFLAGEAPKLANLVKVNIQKKYRLQRYLIDVDEGSFAEYEDCLACVADNRLNLTG